jgi:hypothetical protein
MRHAIRNFGGSEAVPVRIRRHHSDFTDPKGPLLTPDFHIPQGYQGVRPKVMLMYLLNERNQLG